MESGRTFPLLICPSGKSPISCPAPFAKIFCFPLYPNQIYIPRRPVPQRGGSRSSQARGGMRWTRQRQARAGIAGRVLARERSNGELTNGADADGEVVWS